MAQLSTINISPYSNFYQVLRQNITSPKDRQAIIVVIIQGAYDMLNRSIEVSIPACHAGDPGSIPGRRGGITFASGGLDLRRGSNFVPSPYTLDLPGKLLAGWCVLNPNYHEQAIEPSSVQSVTRGGDP
ncbi:hypothetical protein O181_071206 [Austropuccinia psidii MF-1]|uniref:Uncharacterized protein n=1 Tax=Austropuccinia psidii MF-1 TaxID=1389203 RepID=A0A9Q3I6C0_9BASI|nr:hypothetical protein [Austropuccinia psidii MF-1]